jgi:hypothetical protein
MWEYFTMHDLITAARTCHRVFQIIAEYLEANFYYKYILLLLLSLTLSHPSPSLSHLDPLDLIFELKG